MQDRGEIALNAQALVLPRLRILPHARAHFEGSFGCMRKQAFLMAILFPGLGAFSKAGTSPISQAPEPALRFI